ncbi:MAG: LysR family transcriptional regulator, partial [Gammaproteobacteria bacterium]|nr:LysR family transcriptional regulator [Gammaproteobacteria bacterium]
MKRLPTMKQLQYLVALADTRHFGRAAERCHITQSTLSAGIRDLESVLGTAVAERSNRHVLITRVGAQIAERAKALLRDAEEVMEVARAGRSPMTGEMRLGVIPTIGPFLLPRVLPGLRERFPELTVYLREEQTAPLLARLEDGELDAALIALPYETG